MLGLDPLLANGPSFLVSLVGLLGLVRGAEQLWKMGVPPTQTRHMVHVGVSLFVVATPYIFSSPVPVGVLAAVFVVVNAGARWAGRWNSIHEARAESWGTVALPLAVLPALAATWAVDPDRVVIFQTAFLVVGISDPLAAMAGRTFGRRPFLGNATWTGSAVVFGSALVIVGPGLLVGTDLVTSEVLLTSVVIAAVLTVVEAISTRGWDNLFVVLAVVVTVVAASEARVSTRLLAAGVFVGFLFGGLARWTGTLTMDGAAGGGLFAASLVSLGGWAWALPGFVFFVLSSALSMLPQWNEVRGQSEQSETARTIRQVLANGGIAWGFLAVSALLPASSSGTAQIAYVGFLGALAAAAADTWGTECGYRFGNRPRSLTTFERVEPGTSGAVSWIGTLAALVGAGTVVGAALLTTGEMAPPAVRGSGSVVLAGMVGMVLDGLMGATLERRRPTEDRHRDEWGPAGGGVDWVDNDVVNVVGTTTGAVAAIALHMLLG